VSASFRLRWHDEPIAYLAGDIDQIALDDLKDHKIEIKAPLLVFPHHGGNSSSGNVVDFTNELCDLTEANTVIFSIGRRKHDNPRKEVVTAVRAKIKDVRIACTQLSKHCATALNGTVPVHLNSAFARGREANECCGGTFIIELGASTSYLPDLKSHLAFITAAAPTPMCQN
jgi:competence protein ComEC